MDKGIQLITYLQQVYNFAGEYPAPKPLMDKFDLTAEEFDNLIEKLNTPDRGLDQRGLPIYPYPAQAKKTGAPVGKKNDDVLDPRFVMAVDIILNVADKRSTAAKLKDVGFSTQKWNGLLKDKRHKEYFTKRMEQSWGDIELISKGSLLRAAEAGDLQSIKYALELSGTYRPNQELLLNVGILIAKVMEVLTKHVEPNTLRVIADEMEQIINTSGRELENAN